MIAVTWACLITSKISVVRAIIYVFSQLFGSIVGSSLLRSMLSPEIIAQSGMGTHAINPLLSIGQGLWAEVIFTFIFIFVVFATAISPFAGKFTPLRGGEGGGKSYGPGKLTPFAVGMAILMLHTVGIKLTGASMNPARSFGPALVNNKWAHQWVYWIGPILGSTMAAFFSQAVFLSTPRDIFRLNTDTMDKMPDAPPSAMSTVEIPKTAPETKAAIPPTRTPVTPRQSSPARSPREERQQEPRSSPVIQEMHKSNSGQFSAIMQEDAAVDVVELDDI